jgi:general secretion pathway protein G
MKKKKALTLLEIIIVIFLITLITGAIGYSMKGTLDKGRVFRTEQAIEQLRDLFLMCLAEGESADDIIRDPVGTLQKFGLAKNPQKIVEDGWGKKFNLSLARGKKDFIITSDNLNNYREKTGRNSSNEE